MIIDSYSESAPSPHGLAHAILYMRHADIEYLAALLDRIRRRDQSVSKRRVTGDDLVEAAVRVYRETVSTHPGRQSAKVKALAEQDTRVQQIAATESV